MPGMDGFQAIQAIKGNPDDRHHSGRHVHLAGRRAACQPGRALGAVGVLPKTVKHSDVSRVLYQLRLLPERRDAPRPATVAAVSRSGGRARAGRCRSSAALRPSPAAMSKALIRNAVAPLLKSKARRCGASCWPASKLSPGASRRSRPAHGAGTDASAATPEQSQPAGHADADHRRAAEAAWPLAGGRRRDRTDSGPGAGAVLYQGARRPRRTLRSAVTLQSTVERAAGAAHLAARRASKSGRLVAAAATSRLSLCERRFQPYGEAPLSGARLGAAARYAGPTARAMASEAR